MTANNSLEYTSKLAKKLYHTLCKTKNDSVLSFTNSSLYESGELSMFQDDMEYIIDELMLQRSSTSIMVIIDDILEVLIMISSNRLFLDYFASSNYLERILSILSHALSFNHNIDIILTLFSLIIHACTFLGLNLKRQLIGFSSFHSLASLMIKSDTMNMSLDILNGRKLQASKENQSISTILKSFSYYSVLLECLYILSLCNHHSFVLPTFQQLLYILSNITQPNQYEKIINIFTFIYQFDSQALVPIIMESSFLKIYEKQLFNTTRIQLVTLVLNMSNNPLIGNFIAQNMINMLWNGFHIYEKENNDDLVILHIALLCNLYEKHSNVIQIGMINDTDLTHFGYLVKVFQNCSSSLMDTILSSYISILMGYIILEWNDSKNEDYNMIIKLLPNIQSGINNMSLLHQQDETQFSELLNRLNQLQSNS